MRFGSRRHLFVRGVVVSLDRSQLDPQHDGHRVGTPVAFSIVAIGGFLSFVVYGEKSLSPVKRSAVHVCYVFLLAVSNSPRMKGSFQASLSSATGKHPGMFTSEDKEQ